MYERLSRSRVHIRAMAYKGVLTAVAVASYHIDEANTLIPGSTRPVEAQLCAQLVIGQCLWADNKLGTMARA
jgi:hypothetical protein